MKPRFFLLAGLFLVLASGCASPSRQVPSAPETISRVLVQSAESWDGHALPAYPKGQPEVSILHITVPPGVSLPWHRHPVINAGVLIEGELTVTTESGNRLRLTAGDSLIEVVDTWHYGRNEGTTPAVLVVFYAGTEKLPLAEYRNEAAMTEQ